MLKAKFSIAACLCHRYVYNMLFTSINTKSLIKVTLKIYFKWLMKLSHQLPMLYFLP